MRFALVFILLFTSGPARADEGGSDLLERGAQMLLEGLMREIEPALEDLQELSEKMTPALQNFVAEMGPALKEMLEKVEDWSAYHPPEILENGDIIIRRKRAEPKADDDIET